MGGSMWRHDLPLIMSERIVNGCRIMALFAMMSLSSTHAQTLTLENGTLRVKQDLTRGGAISYISKSSVDRNIVNVADEGRYVQQSYYAGSNVNRQAEGQSPSWSPWPWNPIQVGDYARNRAPILEYASNSISSYVKCTPMLWDMNNKPAEAEMEQWTELLGNVIKVRNRITCHRTDSIYGEGLLKDQEVPAVYPISSLSKLYSYVGNEPFSSAPVTNMAVVNLSSGFWGRYEGNMVKESWMAFVDNTDWGMGVYSPSTSNFLAGVAGAFGGEATSGGTCYIAPITKVQMFKNTVYEYQYALIIGTLSDIRSNVYNLAGAGLGAPGSGVWTSAVPGNWSHTNCWSSGLVASGTGNTGDFSTVDITTDVKVGLDSARTIGALVFGDAETGSAAGWTIDNNSNVVNVLTLADPASVTVNTLGPGKSVVIGARLSGTNGLVKQGPGTLTLAATNSYDGATTVNAGVLEVGGSGQLGGGGYNNEIVNNGTLLINSTASQLLGGSISGAGSLVKTNSGLLTISGTNTYAGVTQIAGGTLRVGPTAAVIDPITVVNSGFESPAVSTWTNNPAGIPGWSFSGAGMDHNSGTWYPTVSGHEGVQAGYLQNGSGTISQTITNQGSAGIYTISFQAEGRGGALGPQGVIVEVDGVAVGTWIATDVSQSAWKLFETPAYFSTGTHTLLFRGNNTLGGDKSVAIDNVQIYRTACGILSSNSAFNLSAPGAILDLNGQPQSIGSLSGVAGSTVSNGYLTVGGDNASSVFAGVIAGASTLTKTGAGVLTLSGTNILAGPVTVNGGVLRFAPGSSSSATSVTVNAGSTCIVDTVSSVISSAGEVSLNHSGSNYGVIFLSNGVNQSVGTLLLNGVSQPAGTWGHSGSGSTFTNDSYFAGSGVLTVINTSFAPTVNNTGGSTASGSSFATLTGNLTAGSGANIYIYWGLNDAGTGSTGSWGNVLSLGVRAEGSFSTNVYGLSDNVTYWYRCYASNAYGTAWAPNAASFNAAPSVSALATGGAVTNYTLSGTNYTAHIFTNSGILAVTAGGNVEVLVVAGGGGGGGNGGGGGGAGGLIYSNAYPLVAGSNYTVTVGDGGIGVNQASRNGTNSVFGALTAIGGGGGGSRESDRLGKSGGSGGGGGSPNAGGGATSAGGAGTAGQGRNGGSGVNSAPSYGGGGGGGAGAAGSNGTGSAGGNGGAGVAYNLSGISTIYAGGGGGGIAASGTGGTGGSGIGGNGTNAFGGNGAPCTGSGGGGGGTPGKGGSGIVIVRYVSAASVIQNLAPRGITNNAAILNAALAASTTNFDVTVYWGTTDGGTNTGAWTNSAAVGSWTNATLTNISWQATGLTAATPYYYTFCATNATTSLWAYPSWRFSTPAYYQNPMPADTNADGIADNWASDYFATNHPDGSPANDPDRDGLNNLQEYIAGTNPTNGIDGFVLAVTFSNGLPLVSFVTVRATANYYGQLSRHYALEQSTNMMSTNWTIVPGYSDLTGMGQTALFTNSSPANAIFFRAKAWLE